MDDESLPPALREIVLQLNRGVVISGAGLPTCRRASFAGHDVEAVEKICGDAVVGGGTSLFAYTGPPIGPIPASLKSLVIVNGGVQHGTTKLYAVAPFSPTTSAVVTMPIKVKWVRGSGTRMTIAVPRPSGSRGPLTNLSITFSQERAIVTARCLRGGFLLEAEERFVDGTMLKGSVERDCVVKSRSA